MNRQILVIRLSSLGDVILSSPVVLNLKISFPDCRLVFLTKERFRPVVELFDGVDEIVALPEPGTPSALCRQGLQLDASGIDTVVDLHGNLRSWLLRNITTVAATHVYPKRRWQRWQAARRWLKVVPELYPHTIELYNEAARAAGATIHAERPLMRRGKLPERLAPFFDDSRPVVVIAPGAAHPNKQWLAESFAEVALRLFERDKVRIIWAVTSSEARFIPVPRLPEPAALLELVDCPLDDLAAVIARCALTICNDSGIGHLSSAVGAPVLGIFGPTHPALGFAPRGLYDRVVQVEEPCRPCSRHGARRCFRKERFCFTRIAVDSVASVASQTLTRRSREAPALLVDRDGTLVVNKHYASDPQEIEFVDGAVEALRLARKRGFQVVIISNQSGVARGYFSKGDADLMTRRLTDLLRERGVDIAGSYFCPHFAQGENGNPYAVPCRCRKPSPGMAEQAALELGIDLRRSTVVGDMAADVNLARIIGARVILVRTGYGAAEEAALRQAGVTAVTAAENLHEAVTRHL